MKRIFIIVITVLLGIFAGQTLIAVAECNVNGTPGYDGTSGNDTITCDSVPVAGLLEGVGGQGGSDTIIIEEGSTVSYVGGDAVGQPDSISSGDPAVMPPPASDTIIVNGTVNAVFGDFSAHYSGADDTIIIGVTGNVNEVVGDGAAIPYLVNLQGGNDLIIIDGVVNNNVSGDNLSDLYGELGVGGNDTIIINGTVGGNVEGYIGNDTITLNGTVNGSVNGGYGNDTIVVNDGANGGADGTLLLNGDAGNDTLVFGFTINSEDDYNALAALIASGAANGSITINGQTITWSSFEQLVNALIANFSVGSKLTFKDNRINGTDAGASALAYCSANGFSIYHIDPVTGSGSEAFVVSSTQIKAAVAEAAAQAATVEVRSGKGITLFASPDGQLSLVAPDIADAAKTYQFAFEATICG